MANYSNKRPMESFLVALAAQTSMPTSGTISDSSTMDVNLVNGQLGIVSAGINGSVAMNTFLGASPTIAQAPEIRILQGTAYSTLTSGFTATHPLTVRPYEQSALIDGRGQGVTVTKQLYVSPEHDVWAVGNTVGEADAINILDETEYEISIGFRGRRIQEIFSREEAAYLRSKVVTPNFTDLGYTDAEATSWILNKLGYEINLNSSAFVLNQRRPNKAPVVALLIDTTGTNGVAIGGVDPIAAGDIIPVVTATTGTRSITLTTATATSIKDAAVTLSGDAIADVTWTIVPVDLTQITGTSVADMMFLVALDETLVFVDDIPQVKVYLDVNLPLGFDSALVQRTRANQGTEGEGTARQMELFYQATQGQRKYNLQHEMYPIPQHASPILSTETYNIYSILHSNYHQVDVINRVDSPFRDIVLIPSSNTTLVTAFDTAINAWLASTANQPSIITL